MMVIKATITTVTMMISPLQKWRGMVWGPTGLWLRLLHEDIHETVLNFVGGLHGPGAVLGHHLPIRLWAPRDPWQGQICTGRGVGGVCVLLLSASDEGRDFFVCVFVCLAVTNIYIYINKYNLYYIHHQNKCSTSIPYWALALLCLSAFLVMMCFSSLFCSQMSDTWKNKK